MHDKKWAEYLSNVIDIKFLLSENVDVVVNKLRILTRLYLFM